MSEQLPANPMADFVKRAQVNRRVPQRVEGGFLKFNGKTGQWSLGQEETPVDGEQVLIASPTMMHGFMRWGEVPPAKVYVPLTEPLPTPPEPLEGVDPEGNAKTFTANDALQVSGKFIDDDLGQFIFNTDSMGGVENLNKLFDSIVLQASENPDYCFPLVTLDNEWYKRSTGKVFKPVFTIDAWCDVNGNKFTENQRLEHDEEEEEEAPPTRRRRRKRA